ncbi:MAG: hypothetical protein AAGH68_09160 [Pseudomonadota bacterium]
MFKWAIRIVAGLIALTFIGGAALAGAYYAGLRLPVYSDVAAFALQNWNHTRNVEIEADYDSSLVRVNDRIYVTVDLALPETVRRLRDYLDGGRTLLLDCGPQKVFLHQLENATLTVENPVISISGVVELEMAGLLDMREGRAVAATTRLGHDSTRVWADVTSLSIEDLPDPMVEQILRRIARVQYTREQVLDLAASALSPELAGLLAAHRDALDLAFEDVIAAKAGETVALQAVFSVDEAAAFDMLGDRIASAADQGAARFASIFAPRSAHAQALGGIGDILDEVGGGKAREIIEKGLRESGLEERVEDIAGTLSALTNCRTGF